ncbi:MAG: hypothetical protein HZA91_09325 [Verrucomicrobia bacterium]|nr:hypothetical protein [Verrucomicrobiota bacterium]
MTGMTAIFIGLVSWNTTFFAVTLWLALTGNPWHWAAGLVTGVFTLLVHSIVFMHFIGTGKGIKESVESYDLPNDPQTGYVRRTKKLKARVFPHATFASLAIIAAIWLGGWYHSQRWLDRYENLTAFAWHRWGAYLALLYTAYAFYAEWKAIRENTAMLTEINSLMARRDANPQTPVPPVGG